MPAQCSLRKSVRQLGALSASSATRLAPSVLAGIASPASSRIVGKKSMLSTKRESCLAAVTSGGYLTIMGTRMHSS